MREVVGSRASPPDLDVLADVQLFQAIGMGFQTLVSMLGADLTAVAGKLRVIVAAARASSFAGGLPGELRRAKRPRESFANRGAHVVARAVSKIK